MFVFSSSFIDSRPGCCHVFLHQLAFVDLFYMKVFRMEAPFLHLHLASIAENLRREAASSFWKFRGSTNEWLIFSYRGFSNE
jgi:hypothetical protein